MLDKKVIEDLINLQTDNEIIDEEIIEELQKLKKEISLNDVALVKLFLQCFDNLELSTSDFKNDEINMEDKVKKYLGEFEPEEIRIILNNYGGGNEFGDEKAKKRIENLVRKNRVKYLELIKLFFKIFGAD